MKRTILLFFLILPLCLLKAQIIKGRVVNDTGSLIPNVNIYIDGTRTATVSKEDGSFSLSISSGTFGNVVFQKDDYETFSAAVSELMNKNLKVVLTKTNAIEEIRLVPYTPEAYTNYINYFLDTFIGSDRENVRIKNQKSLKFSYDKKNRFLKVKAPNTLIIENKNLGYEIQYNLISYSSDFKTNMVNYTGTSFFKETKGTEKIKLNRMNAYDGSMLHFFRSIYNNTIPADKFVVNHVVKVPNPKYPTEEELKTLENFRQMVKSSGMTKIPENISDISQRKNSQTPYSLAIVKTLIPDSDYVERKDGKVLFSFKDMLQVNYQKYFYDMKGKELVKSQFPVQLSSFLHPEGETFEVSKEGNISNPDLLINEGDFSKNKIENMLPLDYQLGD
ncbi:carboxypeptidase regulatory-like domain-containing protein [Chryseobacterium sp. L7]|uniref:Carboxypeptidase regulatory-like domain-containing protein n=1 Tax=Chryseobacterium endalhagicum TaxID=2797638 RepID=A0ABS1QMT9_9FLAO|nr:carboxypeptidase-like regulatory domain-containing protein [Chryseobacterium endalhagicum]MBL1223374.1 carboxypeptidase regulatory-like domain-containing protein [Chryseobacterium endalhagicum]